MIEVRIRSGYETFAGWNPNKIEERFYTSSRSLDLFDALNVYPSDRAYHLAQHDDGRWGLFGPPDKGEKYAVEIKRY